MRLGTFTIYYDLNIGELCKLHASNDIHISQRDRHQFQLWLWSHLWSFSWPNFQGSGKLDVRQALERFLYYKPENNSSILITGSKPLYHYSGRIALVVMTFQQEIDHSSMQNPTAKICNKCRSIITTTAKGLASLFNVAASCTIVVRCSKTLVKDAHSVHCC